MSTNRIPLYIETLSQGGNTSRIPHAEILWEREDGRRIFFVVVGSVMRLKGMMVVRQIWNNKEKSEE